MGHPKHRATLRIGNGLGHCLCLQKFAGKPADSGGCRSKSAMRGRLPVFSFRKIRRLHPLHLDAQRAFEREQFTSLVNSEESRSKALRAHSPGSSHAMDEVLGDVRQIVVDDLGYI